MKFECFPRGVADTDDVPVDQGPPESFTDRSWIVIDESAVGTLVNDKDVSIFVAG